MPIEAQTEPKAQLNRIHVSNPKELRDLFAYSNERKPFVSAHRGGAGPGYPENCIATFENTLRHTHSMLEIDLRYTKDGHIVLHHDTTLDRTTTGSGIVRDFTLSELKKLHLLDKKGVPTDYRMPTLEEAIEWARGKAILILDRKGEVSVETCVRIIQENKAQSYVMIMAYNMNEIRAVYDLDPDIMMEVFMGTRERFRDFDQTGVPWNRIIPFISHKPLNDRQLIDMIHAKGSSCMAGTSRYLDRELVALERPSSELKNAYRKLLQDGIDIIETDLPGQVSQIIE
jgi:glycerophosphoryl diester phosphodiesterase